MEHQTEDKKPNPGSREAVDRGCICPRMDNAWGKGIPWPREDGKDPEKYPNFWIASGCPLHAPGEDTDAQD